MTNRIKRLQDAGLASVVWTDQRVDWGKVDLNIAQGLEVLDMEPFDHGRCPRCQSGIVFI